MTRTNLANLKPSTAPAIPLEVLRDLPMPGIYVHKWRSGPIDVIRITGWEMSGQPWYNLEAWNEGRWERRDLHEYGYPPVHYPKLPGLLFSKTNGQIAAGTKNVTRRDACPAWCKPGALFMAWDRSHRVGRGKARGLGVHRVVETTIVRLGDDDGCEACDGSGFSTFLKISACQICGGGGSAEAAREGFPGLSWAQFAEMAFPGVPLESKVARISFEAVT